MEIRKCSLIHCSCAVIEIVSIHLHLHFSAEQVVLGVSPQWGEGDLGDFPTKGLYALALIVIDGKYH